jgi:GNAT superfamily N-acetyltransferase
VDIRRLRAHDADRLRDLRLRALRDSPEAFANTYDSVDAELPSYWQRFADASEAAQRSVNFVAVDGNDRWVAMGAAYLYEDDPETAGFAAMWVDPDARGQGVGRRLLDSLAEWARSRGATKAVIWHTEGNATAQNLYRNWGFAPTGTRRPRKSNPATHWIEMSRTL